MNLKRRSAGLPHLSHSRAEHGYLLVEMLNDVMGCAHISIPKALGTATAPAELIANDPVHPIWGLPAPVQTQTIRVITIARAEIAAMILQRNHETIPDELVMPCHELIFTKWLPQLVLLWT